MTMYENAKLKAKLGHGEFTDPFEQLSGIRQGSALSPSLFIIILDYAMIAYERALELPEQYLVQEFGEEAAKAIMKGEWLGFADDLADVGKSPRGVTERMRQLQGAIRFVGLQLSEAKTECMACGDNDLEDIYRENAQLVPIKFREVTTRQITATGELIEWKGAGLVEGAETIIATRPFEHLPGPVTHIIRWTTGSRQGTIQAVHRTPRGFAYMQDGKKGWMRRNNVERPIITQESRICDRCGQVMIGGDNALLHHKAYPGACNQNLTTPQRERKAANRKTQDKKFGPTHEATGHMKMTALNGEEIKHTNCFKYLGNLVTPTGSNWKEVNKRVAMGKEGVKMFRRMWRTGRIKPRQKRMLYKVMVLTRMLYNCEILSYSKYDMARLERAQTEALRTITRWQRKNEETEFDWRNQISRHDAHAFVGINYISDIISERRLRWLGHIVRETDEITRAEYERVKRDPKCVWYKLLLKDAVKFALEEDGAAESHLADLEELARNKVAWDIHLKAVMQRRLPVVESEDESSETSSLHALSSEGASMEVDSTSDSESQ
jgi:hypothetical protein